MLSNANIKTNKKLTGIYLNYFTISLSITVLLILVSGICLRYWHWDFDDSNIVYRIVKNIINGHGWVYNIGESHNASTSALNTIIITAVSYITGDIRTASHIVGTVIILMAGIIGYLLFREKFGNGIGTLSGYLIIRMLGKNNTWGLESNLFVLLLLLFIFLERRKKNTWLLLPILVLARPDGLLMIGFKWLKEFISKRSYSIWGMFIVTIILMPWLIFSLLKFGQFFPDTFYQKIWQGNSGYWGSSPVYLKGLIRHYVQSSDLPLKIAMILAVIGIFRMKRDRSPFIYITIFVLSQQLAYVTFNVPMYHWYRVLPNFLILIASLYAAGTFLKNIQKHHRLLIAGKKWFVPVPLWLDKALDISVPLVLLIPAFLTLKSGHDNPKVDLRDMSYASTIKKIDTDFGPGRLATVEVGTIGFNTDRKLIDICGLTSSKGQFLTPDRMNVFYGNPPELLLLHNPIWNHESAIYSDYRFHIVYELSANFTNTYLPMQLYKRKDVFDLNDISELQLSEFYPVYKLDERFNSNKLKPLSDGIVCLDIINGQLASKHPVITNEHPALHIQGWALDIKQGLVPKNVFILLIHESGQVYSVSAARCPRIDVAEKYKNAAFNMCGFQATGIIMSLPRGIFKIQIVQQTCNDYYYTELKNLIKITEKNTFVELPSE